MADSKIDLPYVVRYKPYYAELTKGQVCHWCSCGLSKRQPLCDGSHQGTGFQPLRYVAHVDEEVLFCGCKHSCEPPFCDGSHNNLLDVYEQDDPLSEENLRIPIVTSSKAGRVQLNGQCYVVDVGGVPMQQCDTIRWSQLIGKTTGAQHQSQFYFVVEQGVSPCVAFAHSDVIILVTAGVGTLNLSGRPFHLSNESGVYVRPGESFRVHNEQATPIKLYVSVYPQADEPQFLQQMTDNFDASLPQRTVTVDPDNRQMMADRFFQLLVDKRIGSSLVTQFIGEVPSSKAAMHRHLYEEAIVILKGRGFIWTEDMKAAVSAGDVIFLPRKQIHSLECTDPAGMTLAGVICPGDNPSINY